MVINDLPYESDYLAFFFPTNQSGALARSALLSLFRKWFYLVDVVSGEISAHKKPPAWAGGLKSLNTIEGSNQCILMPTFLISASQDTPALPSPTI